MSNEIKHYRLLNEGEEIKPDDEYYNGSKWHPCGPPIKGYENVTYRHSPIRRATASEETGVPWNELQKYLNAIAKLPIGPMTAKQIEAYESAEKELLKFKPITRAEAELKGGKEV